MLTPLEMTGLAVRALDGKKGADIRAIETRDVTVLADYFVICTAGSTTQIKALADEVEKVLKENGEAPLRVEGYRSGGWVLVDFGCLVVHLFLKELRGFYSLERLWSDARDVDVSKWLEEDGRDDV
ncbi:MAG: ribosome silencing factor [Oscillospiraceae bacterium]|jgi:ribosome-associated protein|nr:ribosome silencing factor [Oscillospiraceae bacterium]